MLYRLIYEYDEIIEPDNQRSRRETMNYYGDSTHLQDFLRNNLITFLNGKKNAIFSSIKIEVVEGIFLNE